MFISCPGFSHAQEETFYFLTDHLGSVEVVLDENANVVERRDYLPYGTSRVPQIPRPSHVSDTVEPRSFTGKQLDTQTGLYYYSARYYDPLIGRFASIDPLTLDEAKTSNKTLLTILENPQNLNAYTYALNNPLFYIDLFGEDAEAMAGFGRMIDGGIKVLAGFATGTYYPQSAIIGGVPMVLSGAEDIISGFMLAASPDGPQEFSEGEQKVMNTIDKVALTKVPLITKAPVKTSVTSGTFEREFRDLGELAESAGKVFRNFAENIIRKEVKKNEED